MKAFNWFINILTLGLIIAKLTGNIDWSWLLVVAPWFGALALNFAVTFAAISVRNAAERNARSVAATHDLLNRLGKVGRVR